MRLKELFRGLTARSRSFAAGLILGLLVLSAPGLAAATCTYDITFTGAGGAQAVTLDTFNTPPNCDALGAGLAFNLHDHIGSSTAPIGFTDIFGSADQQFTFSPSSNPATTRTTAATITVDGVVSGGLTTNLKFTLVTTGGATTETVTVFAESNASNGDDADIPVTLVFHLPASVPTVTSVSPTAGPTAGQTSVTVAGAGFSATPSSNAVYFGATAATVTSASTTSLTVTAPAHPAGTVDVTVTTSGGTSATSASDHYAFVSPPTIAASFSPTATAVGSTSALTLTLSNAGGGTFTSLAESTTLPAGLAASSPSTTCGGTVSVGGGGVLNLSGGTLSGASCTVTATVTATSSGSKSLTPGGSSAPHGDQGGATITGVAGSAAALTVNAALSTTQAVPSTTLTVGVAATPFTPVTASGGTGTISYALSGGTLPAGLNFSTSTGQITGTPTATLAATTFTVTATDQTAPTPQTSSKTFSLTVNPAPVTLTTTQAVPSTTLTENSAATPFTPVTAAGGTGTISYALSGGTLPTGLNFSTATGQITGTPTATLTATIFTVTATDQTAPTPQTSSKTFSLTVNPAPVTLTTTQAVPSTTLTENSAATPFTPVTAAGGTGTISYALSGGALPAGLNFSTATGQITGTPTATLAATIFTVTATDQTTPTPQTSSKTFSLTVNPAPVTLTTTQAVPSTTLTENSAATPFTPVTASGGTGTISYALSGGTLPAGLNFSTATGQITGTPTATLAATIFTVTATDQTTPTPQTSSKTFSLTVNAAPGGPPAPPVAIAKTVAAPPNQALIIAATQGDRGIVSSVMLVSQPAHGSVTVNGLSIIYTPTQNYVGPDSFTYKDTGPGGVSSPATISITVAPLAPPTVAAQTATVVSGQAVDINAAAGATGGPFTVGAIATQPDHGAATANGQTFTYAAPANFAGVATFTYTLANTFGVSAPATVTVTVNPAPTVAASTKVTLDAGHDGSLDLTAGATGGPFIAATVASVSPAEAGTATITTLAGSAPPADTAGTGPGSSAAAAADGPHFLLSFKPAAHFSGVATVTFTLSNAFATSAPGQVVFTVRARPDPTLDPDVGGLIVAETEAARRFGEAQIQNFDRRLESLHDGARGKFANDLSMGLSQAGPDPWEAERHRRDDGLWPIGPTRPGLAAAAESGKPTSGAAQDQRKAPSDLAMWSGGAIDFGLHGGSADRAKFRFTTAGISFGADYRLNDQFSVGAGAGYGRDSSRIGGDGSKVEADNYVGAVYGSYRPGHNAFIDIVVGYGELKFDTRRFVAADSAFASGQRRGQETFASVTGGYDFRQGPLSLSTYGRLDSIGGGLDAYTEREAGGGANALSFHRQSLSVLSSTVGLHAAYAVRVASWLWAPHLRLEYKYDLETAGLASLQYADDLVGPSYSRVADPLNRNQFSVEFGTDLRLRTMSFGLDYRADVEGREDFVNQIIGRFGLRF